MEGKVKPGSKIDSNMNLPDIPSAETPLPAWQCYVGQNVKARGWDKASDLETFLLFSEEVGELAKALRRHRGLFTENVSPETLREAHHNLGEEMADVLSYLLDLACRLEVDLAQALLDKERRNRERSWD